ncbi:alpha/beta fold hydrolase [Lysobacter sp. K5869]|uniref:alpha/beta hydrolase n=1 Tax=Lysobacter sp. K5869 TaxID=2820808 RepID=UPI001C05F34D|nr:alpha/beta fold hydrolase [Lysobacter sp. K5869]QWP75434.1 alpha/beta fold hydrolase [Lysobacter sp. K5869]
MYRRDFLGAAALGAAWLSATATVAAREAPETHEVPWTGDGGERLRLAAIRRRADGPAALYVHGATFPAALSVDWRMHGQSWLDQWQANGVDAWAFDFAGYGRSQRPAAFAGAADAAAPFGRLDAAAAQIVAVVERIRAERGDAAPVHLIAHSWGTLPAQRAAILRPELIARLVLFGPVVPAATASGAERSPAPAWHLMSAADQRPRQRTGMPARLPTPVSEAELERWVAAYLDSDPDSAQRTPRAVKVPGGPIADIAACDRGEALVDSGRIRQPTLIVRGEWDHVTGDADAARLFAALTHAADKRDVKIAGGNHWLHLQPQRRALWAETLSFLREG